MEMWFFILITISFSALLRSLFNLLSPAAHPLPPGPRTFPVIGNIKWLKKSFMEIESIINSLHRKLGPVITLRIGSRPSIFIADRALAHQALVGNGAVFSNRPAASTTTKIATSNQTTISSSFYGLKWRLLRRNLTSEILHPSRVKSYSHARKWILQILIERFESQSKSGDPVNVVSNFQYAMFCLLVFMCLGDKLNEKQIKEIERVQRAAIVGGRRFEILNYWPSLTKILLKKRWSEFFEMQKQREEVMIPLIRARKQSKEQNPHQNQEQEQFILSYVDTLLNLELPDEKRKLTEKEILSLCNEFLNAGTDTTSTALQWIMANLVKFPEIQEKLYNELKDILNQGENAVKEEQLESMPYLKAVILEGLRRHPPGHFVLPHSVTKDIVLGNYLIPKTANVNFMVAEMGWDSKVWEDPMEFRPERFRGSDKEFDITGIREIKMMPFGVGRRICPGYGLAILHLEYFVANLVWKYEWKGVEEVDLSEKQEFTIVMKNPLRAKICPRF